MSIVYNKDGTIDYDSMLTEGMGEHNRKMIEKYDKLDNGTSMSMDKYIQFVRKLRKKEWHCISLDEKDEDDRDNIQEEEVDDIDNGKDVPLRPIKREESIVDRELKAFPELKTIIISSVADIDRGVDVLNNAQKITVYDVGTRWGKNETILMGTTYIGTRIGRQKDFNFGCVNDMDIDTIPLHSLRAGTGQEATYLSTYNCRGQDKLLINRRFLSRLLSTWCYIAGIRYNKRNEKITGMSIWGKTSPIYRFKFLTGQDGVGMLRDMLFIIRSKYPTSLDKLKCMVSSQLYNIIYDRVHKKGNTIHSVLMDIRNVMYRDYKVGRFMWGYSKYNAELLVGYIEELASGNYILPLAVPLIYDLYKYPILCKDTHMKPMTQDKHISNAGDYDLTQYNQERI